LIIIYNDQIKGCLPWELRPAVAKANGRVEQQIQGE
jgi:hypothetical protein